ncbi:MAG: acetolactate synthase small subunit [Spirochaetae bacterium HGW-Spirochaetae-1]|jgi:acetolactate synthase-1/3 small subunit|nr:MAG: acetolactate synthase small subunit [Spirochaetae bacterium HGW-Spirochaetae-1]
MNEIILELIVRNHPGVMSQVTGLFSRRSFNLEGILCAAMGKAGTSRMFLLVGEDIRLEQVLRQLGKLYDVLDIIVHDRKNSEMYAKMERLLKEVAG